MNAEDIREDLLAKARSRRDSAARLIDEAVILERAAALVAEGAEVSVKPGPRIVLSPPLTTAQAATFASNMKARSESVTLLSMAARVLEEEDRPLHADELLQKLAELGRPVEKMTLVGALAKSVRLQRGIFTREGPNRFGLKKWSHAGKADETTEGGSLTMTR